MSKPDVSTPSPVDIAAELRERLELLAPDAGWDNVQVITGKKGDPVGTIRIAYLGHQGNVPVRTESAMAYLDWLKEGNRGTIFKWAKDTRRGLGL